MAPAVLPPNNNTLTHLHVPGMYFFGAEIILFLTFGEILMLPEFLNYFYSFSKTIEEK
jgi:hypothetical protein